MRGPMLNLTQYNGFSARAPSATVTYVGKTEDTSSATTYTFTDHAIGTAANDRYVIVGVFGFEDSASTKTISSMTIGGVAATELVELSAATMGGCWGFYGLSVPTGTTATIAVTFSAIQDGSAVMVWRANSLISTSPSATATDNTSSAALSTTISIQDGGIGIAICGRQSANTTYSWAGLTEDD